MNLPLLALGHKLRNFGFRLLLRYDVMKKLEKIIEVFQFSVIFLAKSFQLGRIFVADSRVELCQGILRNCLAWGPTLRTFVRERPCTKRPSFAHRLHVIDQQFQRLDVIFVHSIRQVELD